MAGRHYSFSSITSKNPRSKAILLILSITLLFFVFSLLSSPSSSPSSSPFIFPTTQNPSIDYSFVSSLQKFLSTNPKPKKVANNKGGSDDDDTLVKKLDNSIWEMENQRIYNQDSIFPVSLPIKVYVYDMPAKFTYDLLWLFHNSYRDTFNLTSNGSPVHRLIEQHSIDYWLWADLIAPLSERPLKKLVVRVDRQEEADLFYIPFFTTISFFLLEKQQCKALYRVKH